MERINDIATLIEAANKVKYRSKPKTKKEICETIGVTRPTLDRIIRIGQMEEPYRMMDVYKALIRIRRNYEAEESFVRQNKRKSFQ